MATTRTATEKPEPATAEPERDIALEKVQHLVWGFTELLMGQRKINGRLQAAHEETIKVLKAIIERLDAVAPAQSAKKASSTDESLKKIAEHAEYVGGDEPPGCQLPGGN
jgi:hypothetical protein